MSALSSSTHTAVTRRWRVRLAITVAVLGLGAAVATAVAIAHDESLVVPLFLWLGVGALALALQQVPRSVTSQERPRMAASAARVVVGIMLYVVVPVVLNRF
ncbi:hypothetical protein [Nocardioides sp. B-3]|uniref:hypothetical protein n=1 Tax=Nocardioides sp. B-3 TaxID=2895565 RepID=UPI002153852B|nr:hypothetical protein [Nocardioides sp. B-3]UUZ60744.1 hypothetical protein LP418_08205 [Nocardioides sp. B-3]